MRPSRRTFLALSSIIMASRPQAHERPLIGFLNMRPQEAGGDVAAAFRAGLMRGGIVDGVNVLISYKWANGRRYALRRMAKELIDEGVTVIVAGGAVPALEAKLATSAIPIVFFSGADPVRLGLVTRLDRPIGNLTGVTQYNHDLSSKLLDLLHELVPAELPIVAIINANDVHRRMVDTLTGAAQRRARRLVIIVAEDEESVRSAFSQASEIGAAGVLVAASSYFAGIRHLFVSLAAKHRIPTAYPEREFVEAGGLFSYGPSILDAYRLVGAYVAEIVHGRRPEDLPIVQTAKYELIVNSTAAKELGLAFPPQLAVQIDEEL